MQIHAGYEISYACAQPTPMITMLSVHPSRKTALITPDLMRTDPSVPTKEYIDGFGNICRVVHAPAGNITLSSDFIINDDASPDEIAPYAQHSMENLPVDTLVYLLGSRYCETDRFIPFAWAKFGNHPKMAAGSSDLRLRERATSIRLPARQSDENRMASLRRATGCVPGFCPSCNHFVPLHEYSSAVLHWLFSRHWGAIGS
jgi:transglutaminase-like putative cysteine protease